MVKKADFIERETIYARPDRRNKGGMAIGVYWPTAPNVDRAGYSYQTGEKYTQVEQGHDPDTNRRYREYKVFDETGYWNAMTSEHEERAQALEEQMQADVSRTEQIKALMEQNRQNLVQSAEQEQREHETLMATVEPARSREAGQARAQQTSTAAMRATAGGQMASGATRTASAVKQMRDKQARQRGQKQSEKTKAVLTGNETTNRNKES